MCGDDKGRPTYRVGGERRQPALTVYCLCAILASFSDTDRLCNLPVSQSSNADPGRYQQKPKENTMRTRAALAREIGKLTVEEIELDPPKEHEVLVRMQAAGVCHSDLHTYRGELRAMPPLVLGHEGAGIVEVVGPGEGVTHVRPGDRVMINWIPACETCPTCLGDIT